MRAVRIHHRGAPGNDQDAEGGGVWPRDVCRFSKATEVRLGKILYSYCSFLFCGGRRGREGGSILLFPTLKHNGED